MEVQEYNFSTCKYLVHDNYIIAETIQNLDVSTKEVDDLYSIVKERMNEGFGLIEIRPNNTSIDPSVYMYAEQLMPNLKAFALVTESE